MNKIDITNKVLFFIIVSFSMLFLSSCNDDKDVTKPTSSLALTSYDSKTNFCTYTLSTSDNTAIKSIFIYKNDSLIYKNETTNRSSVKKYSSVLATCKFTPNGYKIRAVTEDFGGNVTQDTISSPVVSAVSSPQGGESWTSGTTQAITWTSNFSGSVNIQLFKDNVFYQTIASNVSNTGKYTWTVPYNVVGGSNYRIRVSSVAIDAVKCLSNTFTLVNLSMTTINGYTLTKNETWSGTILLKGDIVVPSGITLTINPGTIINIATGTPVYDGGIQTGKIDFYISGSLIINGNDQNIVQLKSAATTPTNNDWSGIDMNGSQLNVSYCYISDSYYGVFYSSSTSAIKINNCLFNNMNLAIVDFGSLQPTLSYNSFIAVNYGYWLFKNNRNSKLDYSEFKNNTNDVLFDANNSSISINYSNFSGNKGYNLNWVSESVTDNITANYCYGITTTNVINNGNGNTYTYTNQQSTFNSSAGCGFSSMAKSPSSPSYIIGNVEQKKSKMKEINEEMIKKSKDINRQLTK